MNLATFGRRIGSFAAAAAITLTCGLWTDDASADNRVGEFVTNAADWTYAPVITRLPNGSGADVITVDNVLAVAKPGIANGENLIAVWYVRESPGGTTWAAKTWEDTTWAGIARRLKDDLGLTDEELAIFGQGPAGSAAASAPLNYIGGFVAGDPMEPIVNGSDPNSREMLVEILKDTGYKIADPVFDEKDECGRDDKLNYYSTASVAALSAPTEAASVQSMISALVNAPSACLKKPIWPSQWQFWIDNPRTIAPIPATPWFMPACTNEPGPTACTSWTRLYAKPRIAVFELHLIPGTNSYIYCRKDCTVNMLATVVCCSPGTCPPGAPPAAPTCALGSPGYANRFDFLPNTLTCTNTNIPCP